MVGEITQSVKPLPCKHSGPCSCPQNPHEKPGVMAHISRMTGRGRQLSETSGAGLFRICGQIPIQQEKLSEKAESTRGVTLEIVPHPHTSTCVHKTHKCTGMHIEAKDTDIGKNRHNRQTHNMCITFNDLACFFF